MEASYSEADRAQLNSLLPELLTEDGGLSEASDALADIAVEAARKCTELNGWDDDQGEYATIYEIGRVMEEALRASTSLDREKLARLDQAVADVESDAFWLALERVFSSGDADPDNEATDEDLEIFERLLAEVGLSDDEASADAVGVILVMMALQRTAIREFGK